MGFRAPLVNFSKGEIAPDLYGRFDVQTYSAALKKARNCVVLKYGGITMRPGTRLVAEAYDSGAPVRLVPFQFSNTQAYALEFGQATVRLAATGGLVVESELAITGITNAAQAVITVPFHPYAVGDEISVSGVTGMEEINRRVLRVVAVLTVNMFQVDLDTSGFGTFTGAVGGELLTATPPPVVPPTVPPPVDPEEPPVVIPPWGGDGFVIP